MHDEDVSVLIVGGGLSGLSAAMFLARLDVPVLLIERHAGMMIHPRARTINPRSVELFRQAGVVDTILANRSYSSHPDSLLFRAETLSGAELFRSPLDAPSTIGEITPCDWAPIDQDRLEVILRDRAIELGADIRFSTELISFDQDADGVTAVIENRETGQRRTVRSCYLVAADGNRSVIRSALGLGTHGHGLIGTTMTLVFEADLSVPLRGRRLGICHLDRPAPGTVMLQHDGERRWVFSMPYHPERGESLSDFTDERCVALIREAVGVADLPVRIVPQLADGRKVLSYELAARVTDRFRAGRVFLVGDAAHVMPPTGAFGASTGIADSHNLAWKLAAIVHKEAGPDLLASYDEERRPVSELTVEQALLQLWRRTDKASGPMESPFVAYDYYATVMGYRYRSTAVVDAPGDEVPPALSPRELNALPGTRAPHVPLLRGRQEISTLDLFGRGLTLVAAPQGTAWVEGLTKAGDLLGVLTTAHRVGADVRDHTGTWQKAFGIGDGGAALVRPDGFVAWRAYGAPGEPAERVLERALRQILGRTEE